MKSFLKYTLASIFGLLITFLIVFFVGIGMIASSTSKEPIKVKPNSILKIDLSKPILERQPVDPFADFNFGEMSEALQGLDVILASIEKAKTDDNIKGIYLDGGLLLGGGIASLDEIRNALEDFKGSGKFIITYAENYTQKAFYLSSVADAVYLNPMGLVDFKGLYAELSFFKNAMEKLEVEMQIIRGPGNKFKSAVEPFMLDHISEANQLQTQTFLGSIWNSLKEKVSKSRNINSDELQKYADNLTSYDAKGALNAGLVDGLLYWDQAQDSLKNLVGAESIDDIQFISLAKYQQTLRIKNRKAKDKIAIIYAQGEIQGGEGDDQTIGSERIAKAIRSARQDSSIKAIVLRVNSPGGSALASEVMYRELILTKKTKPIVVSMGDYAASGGYYISCMADKIYAQPTTITGSIGVFGMIPNFQKFMNNKIGINFDGVKTGANADIASVMKPLSPFQTEVIRNSVDHIYRQFIGHVAEGRKMSVEAVDAIGQGRVWSGADAKELGLVDELGNIKDAVAAAAQLAKLETYKIKDLPKKTNPLEVFVKQFEKSTSVSEQLKSELGVYGAYLDYFSKNEMRDQYQARLPFFMVIE